MTTVAGNAGFGHIEIQLRERQLSLNAMASRGPTNDGLSNKANESTHAFAIWKRFINVMICIWMASLKSEV